MTKKKQYKNRLPTVLPPAPRRPMEQTYVAPQREAADASAPSPPAPRRPDATAAPTSVETPAPRRSATVRTRALVGVAVLIGLVGVAAAFWWQSGEEEAERPSAASTSATWPEAGEARTVTQVRPDGVLEVTHWIHATDPLDKLDLMLPERQEGDPTSPISASAVQVVADDQPASGPAALTFTRASYVFADATRIRVRYELTGAVEVSTSAPGRGLATTTSLEVSNTPARETRVVRSPAVLSLACTDTTGSTAPCGAPDHTGQWTVELTGDEVGARVIAVVTLTP